MFEYMASGTPIIASDLPSIKEILNKNNALLVDAGNPNSLVLGIKKILTNSSFSQRIKNQAYSDVQKYDWENRSHLIINFINQ